MSRSSSPHRSSRSSSDSSSDRHGLNSLGEHSTSALILVHDNQDDDSPFTYSDDDEETRDIETGSGASEPALPSSVVFAYFLAPCLKLGAMLILSSQAALKVSIPSLVLFSLLSGLARQIWFLLARYVRNPDVGKMLIEAFARGAERDGLRRWLRAMAIGGGIVTRVLLSCIYLRGAADAMQMQLSNESYGIPTQLLLVIVFMLFLAPICVAPNLASKRLVYTNWLSIALYILWIVSIIFAHSQGTLDSNFVVIPRGRLLQDITSIAFSFASLSTLQMYKFLVGPKVNGERREKRYLFMTSVSLSATLVGLAMLLPLLLPLVKKVHHEDPKEDDLSYIQAAVATLTSFILLLAIPPLMISAPPMWVPARLRRMTSRPIGKYCLLVILPCIALLPSPVISIIEDVTLVLVLLSAYFLPALLHIVLHHMRRPLSILVATHSPHTLPSSPTHDPDTQELLLRKERVLQRRRSIRRIAWDLGVWFLLVPIGGGGLVWGVGRLIGTW